MVHTFQTIITGQNQATPTPLRPTTTRATWLQVFAPSSNGGPITLYGAEPAINQSGQQNQLIASNAGIPIAAGGIMFFPFAGAPSPYDLSLLFCTSINGTDIVEVVYLKV